MYLMVLKIGFFNVFISITNIAVNAGSSVI